MIVTNRKIYKGLLNDIQMKNKDYTLGKTVVFYTNNHGPIFIGKLVKVNTENRRITLQPSTVEPSESTSNVLTKGYVTSERFRNAMTGDVRSDIPFDRISGYSDITSLLEK